MEDYDGSLDVVFLDIEMPHMDGMTATRKIREKDSVLGIVFVTNIAQYAIHGFGVRSIKYIAQKYKGTLLTRAENNRSLVDILFYPG